MSAEKTTAFTIELLDLKLTKPVEASLVSYNETSMHDGRAGRG